MVNEFWFELQIMIFILFTFNLIEIKKNLIKQSQILI